MTIAWPSLVGHCMVVMSFCCDAFASESSLKGNYICLLLCAVIRTALKSVAGKVTRSSLNVAKLAIFWTGVFIAARFILESN